MDFALRCNVLTCRAALTERAVVTTCCHIFCGSCADQVGLTQSSKLAKQCPACQTTLPQPDDVAINSLSPSEDYKTSVLSGMSPTVVMECAGRGIAFYAYQVTQEIFYQEHVVASVTGKYQNLSVELDKTIHDANAEITRLKDKLKAAETQSASLKVKCAEIHDQLNAKTRLYNDTHNMYNKLKARTMDPQLASAASHNADDVLLSAQAQRHEERLGHGGGRIGVGPTQLSVDGPGNSQIHMRQRSRGEDRHDRHRIGTPSTYNMQNIGRVLPGQHVPLGTPSHRQQLPVSGPRGTTALNPNGYPSAQGDSHRRSRENLNVPPGVSSGYGMTYAARAGNRFGRSPVMMQY